MSDVEGRVAKPLTFFPEKDEEKFKQDFYAVISNPFFSPDGKHVIFDADIEHRRNRGRNDSGIYRVDVDGENQKRLSDGQLIQWIP